MNVLALDSPLRFAADDLARCRDTSTLRGSTLLGNLMTKGTGPGAHGCSQSRPSRRQTPTTC
jgi:hypothetical protein